MPAVENCPLERVSRPGPAGKPRHLPLARSVRLERRGLLTHKLLLDPVDALNLQPPQHLAA